MSEELDLVNVVMALGGDVCLPSGTVIVPTHNSEIVSARVINYSRTFNTYACIVTYNNGAEYFLNLRCEHVHSIFEIEKLPVRAIDIISWLRDE